MNRAHKRSCMIAFHVTDTVVYSFDVSPGKLDVVEFNEDEESFFFFFLGGFARPALNGLLYGLCIPHFCRPHSLLIALQILKVAICGIAL